MYHFHWLSTMLLMFILVLSFTFDHKYVSEAAHIHQKRNLPSAVVVGTVYCDTCFQQHFAESSRFISGALVAVECSDTSTSKPSFREEVKTNLNGEFKVNLPFSVSKHVKKIMGCSVKLISSSEPYCAVASTATSSSIRLKSKKPGTHIFSAGFFTFKPLKQPELCNQKRKIKNSMELGSQQESGVQHPNDITFPPPLQDPPIPFLPPVDQGILPPLPELPKLPPLPSVPPLPRVPGIPLPPILPKKDDELSNQKTLGIPFPPNPFQPPSLLPPNPFLPPPSILPPVLPSPPPSLFPPIFPSPPSSVFPPIVPSPSPPRSLFPPFIFPPLPGFTPSPSPPPPAFPIPLPPGFPGIPPASSSKKITSP